MSLPRYPEYRDSGVEWLGEVPAHWEVSTLRRVIRAIESGVSVNATDSPAGFGEIGVLKTSCVYRREFDPDENKLVVPEELERVACPVTVGTLIVSRMNTPDLVGAAGLVRCGAENLFLPDRLWQVHFKEANTAFVHYWTQEPSYRAQVQSACAGSSSSMQNLSQDEFRNFALPLPTVAEQTVIADFLDRETAKIDALIAEQDKLLALLAEKRQATISHAVTKGLAPDVPMKDSGVEWLGEVPRHWKLMRIRHVVSTIEQGWSPQCENFPVEAPDEWGVLKVGCVNGGGFRPSENKKLPLELAPMPAYALKRGDLLISRANTRELVGSAAVVQRDFNNLLLCDKLYRLRLAPGKCLAAFAAAYLSTREARSQIELDATGASSSMLNIGQSAVLDLLMPLPVMDEQKAIAEFISAETARLDALAAEATRAIALLKERRTALISAAVTGKIDVRYEAAQPIAPPCL